jgi:thiosulfate/3-mercaptopyruvate sulfurtransferase
MDLLHGGARRIEMNPIVSTSWLNDNAENLTYVVIDIRNNEDYQTGHIPGAINAPFPSWFAARDGLLLELPDETDLFKVIGAAGIKADSRVIIVNKTDNSYALADAARVADTLIYAGIGNVAILDGGHDKWVREARPLSCIMAKTEAVEYVNDVDPTMFVSKGYVREKIGKSIILDARDANVYFGVTREPHAERAGHIPGAKSLPAPWVWTKEGTYIDAKILKEMASSLVGKPESQEIIIYCGVGGYTSAWWFIFTRILGYQNVKFYDGSAQDWTRDAEMPIVKYRWE